MKEVYKFKGRRIDVTGRPYYIWTYRDPMYFYYTTSICTLLVDEFWRSND